MGKYASPLAWTDNLFWVQPSIAEISIKIWYVVTLVNLPLRISFIWNRKSVVLNRRSKQLINGAGIGLGPG